MRLANTSDAQPVSYLPSACVKLITFCMFNIYFILIDDVGA